MQNMQNIPRALAGQHQVSLIELAACHVCTPFRTTPSSRGALSMAAVGGVVTAADKGVHTQSMSAGHG